MAQAAAEGATPEVDAEAELVDSDDAVRHSLAVRRRHMASNVSLSYSSSPYGPLLLRRASGCSLFDHRGRRYLDCVNNVAHVGHSHPRLVQAATQQMQRINTNTVTAAAAAAAARVELQLRCSVSDSPLRCLRAARALRAASAVCLSATCLMPCAPSFLRCCPRCRLH
jgi:acetylornithine/succinyldiaminopimelate/putrescine aminotransferase